jgi:hypothetical protein
LDGSWSGKFLFLTVLFWGFLISVSYNAILTSVMATSRMSPPITSLEEMLQSPDYTLALRPSGSVRDFFQSAPNNTLGTVLFIQNKQLLHIVPKIFYCYCYSKKSVWQGSQNDLFFFQSISSYTQV